jgi:hypothetical protein
VVRDFWDGSLRQLKRGWLRFNANQDLQDYAWTSYVGNGSPHIAA